MLKSIKFFENKDTRIKIDGRHAYIQTKDTNGEWSKAKLALTQNLELSEMNEASDNNKDEPNPVCQLNYII